MIHTVSIKKLINLSNPYEITPEGLDKPITLEEIENSLKKAYILRLIHLPGLELNILKE